MSKKKPNDKKMSLYSNLSKKTTKMSQKRKTKKDAEARRRAEYLATLPKHPVKRFFYRMHPKRFWAYWFSKRGMMMALKVTGVAVLLVALFVGGLFAYFRKDLDQIRPGEIDKRVQSTVTTYLDRNGQVLWEDKGDGNYKLVVKSEDLSDNLKKATVAIEDRDFFKHSGVSVTGTVRAAFNNFTGGEVQGGSTLTQQLVKQVFFSDEADNRGLGGIPRKIKELILAIEIERMYDKDQILTLYLNESPYGGRRNGAESGAQTYFGKSAKDLTLAEASLLAAVPQNPAVYDPYNVEGHTGLINRQHLVLKAMKEIGYITQAQYDEAIAVPILDSIKPQTSQYENIKAPHFVQMVRSQLETELGKATVGRGGLTVKTTLDIRIQEAAEKAMADMFASSTPAIAGFSNGAATVEDTQTGQIVALVGSRDFNYEGYGQDNAATAYIQPGSTVKGFVYAELFQQKKEGMQNYGSGSILVDEPIDKIYGAQLQNADRSYKGSVTIRTSLATSRNVPAVKAMYINEQDKEGSTIQEIRDMGAKSYCTVGADKQAGLSAAIGGCGVKQVDLVNAYASLARMGVYKDQASVLEVKNSSGEVLKKWSDSQGKRIIDQQSAYIIADILTDASASASLGNYAAKNIPGVKTATKTGTSDKGGNAKDLWMMSYNPVLTMGVWLGNPDTTILKKGTSSIGSPIIASTMKAASDIYASEGKYTANQWYTQPAGMQRVGKEIYPSWWSKSQGQTNDKLTFDRVSMRKATACTPEGAKVTVDVLKTTDPVSKKDSYANVPDGYNSNEEDNVHSCSDATPTVSGLTISGNSAKFTVTPGTFSVDLSGVTVTSGGSTLTVTRSGNAYTANGVVGGSFNVNVVDTGYYTTSGSL